MKFTEFSHTFDYSLEKVLEGREARYENREWWPEIIGSEIISEEEFEGAIKKVRSIKLENKLPTNKLFKDSHYTATEVSKYDTNNAEYSIESTLNSHEKLLLFLEKSIYTRLNNDQDKCIRTITLQVNVKVPLIGIVAEQAISSEFKKLSDKDRDTINQYLASKYR